MNLLSYVMAFEMGWCTDIFSMPLDIVFVHSWYGAKGVKIYSK